MENILSKIEEVVQQSFELEELQDCFLVDIEQNNTMIRIFIDRDEGVSFAQCQKLSRAIEAFLDESLILGEKYTLEVSSPGLSRPLKFLRQFPRNIGREFEFKMNDGTKLKGELTDIKDNVLYVSSKGKKKKEVINHEIVFDAVDSAKVLVSFGKQKVKK